MIVAVREIHSSAVCCLKHDTLQNTVDSISLHLALFHSTICSTPADSVLHRNEKCVLSSTVNCWNSENAGGSFTPTFVSNIWLLSSAGFVANKRTHCPALSLSSVMAAVQFYPDISLFSAPSSSTFITGPSSDIIGGRLGVSSFHELSGLSVMLFPTNRSPMNRLLRDEMFSWFSSCSRLCITL
jgi:hypothetical protein